MDGWEHISCQCTSSIFCVCPASNNSSFTSLFSFSRHSMLTRTEPCENNGNCSRKWNDSVNLILKTTPLILRTLCFTTVVVTFRAGQLFSVFGVNFKLISLANDSFSLFLQFASASSVVHNVILFSLKSPNFLAAQLWTVFGIQGTVFVMRCS